MLKRRVHTKRQHAELTTHQLSIRRKRLPAKSNWICAAVRRQNTGVQRDYKRSQRVGLGRVDGSRQVAQLAYTSVCSGRNPPGVCYDKMRRDLRRSVCPFVLCCDVAQNNNGAESLRNHDVTRLSTTFRDVLMTPWRPVVASDHPRRSATNLCVHSSVRISQSAATMCIIVSL